MSDDLVEAALDANADAAYAQWTHALWALRRHQAAKGDLGAIADCASMDAILNLRVSPAPSGVMKLSGWRYSHSDGKDTPELKALFDAVCMVALMESIACTAAPTPDPMKDWLSPRDYVGGPLVVNHAAGMGVFPLPPREQMPASKVDAPKPIDPKAPKPPSEALSRAIGAKKP